jgi:tRNA nucleotidyltransferase (CCA-adding enzyme)
VIAKACDDPAQIPQRIHAARVAAVKALGLQQSHQD